MRRRVLYVTMSTFPESVHSLGGNIYSKNNLHRMKADDGIELFVLSINQEPNRQGTAEYFQSMGVDHLFCAIHPPYPRPEKRTFFSTLRFMYSILFFMPNEIEAMNQNHIVATAEWAIQHWKIDYVIIDYVPAVLFWKSIFDHPIEKAIITVNREAELYRESLRLGLFQHGRFSGWMSSRRVAAFERRVYRSFSKVITIGKPDIPPYLAPSKTACITPYLDPRSPRWQMHDSKEIFFVGSTAHYPNRLAMEYIATRLAPAVAKQVPDVTFTIIGANEADVPSEWRHPSIRYLGRSDAAEVERRFLSCRLFICPVRNTFGMKYKVAEALAYGTPFLASPETMLCVPYLEGQPAISLDDPSQAATEVSRLLTSDIALQELSDSIKAKHEQFVTTQTNIWSRTLFGTGS